MKATLTSSRAGGGVALQEVSSALGVEGSEFSSLGLEVNGQRAAIAVEKNAETGAPMRLRLSVSFEGPRRDELDESDQPVIALRQETETDVRDKARALTHEVQVGYEKFDSTVFIDNDSTEADVRRILAKEATRQAAMRLLEAGYFVRISVHRVTAVRAIEKIEKHRPIAAEPVVNALEDLLILARAGGPTPGTRPERRGSGLLVVSVVTLMLSLVFAWGAHAKWPGSWALATIGLVFGAVVAIFSRPSIEEACAGDSGSGARARSIIGAFAASATALVFGTIMFLNGAFDDSAPTVRHGVVISAPVMGRKRQSESTVVRWRDGSTSALGFDLGWVEYSVGDRVKEYAHPGALGFTWSYVVADR